MHNRILAIHGRTLNLNQAHIMGILNCTPDSFSDGGKFNTVTKAYDQACYMVEAGATIIDIGGESTRPNAQEISLDEEMSRVIPVVEKVATNVDAMISIDSSSPELILEASKYGIHIWNDVRALTRANAINVAKQLDLAVCLMHMQGTPQTMQNNPHYHDVVNEVIDFLLKRTQACEEAKISSDKIILDPGFGFGKSLEDNYRLLCHFATQLKHRSPNKDYTLLYGLSRKGMIGKVIHQEQALKRVNGSVIGAFYSLQQGAHILRVHDVAQTKEAILMFNFIHKILNSPL